MIKIKSEGCKDSILADKKCTLNPSFLHINTNTIVYKLPAKQLQEQHQYQKQRKGHLSYENIVPTNTHKSKPYTQL